MKKSLRLLFIIYLILSLCACGEAPAESGGEGLNIVCTVFPAYDFAREIAGEKANVVLLVPPGSEAHSFEPTPQDIIRIENCDLLLCNGGESEAWLEEILEGRENDILTLTMMDCVETLEEETKEGMQATEHSHEEHNEHEHEEHGHEEEYDEHVWTSPVNAELIVSALCERLCEIDPENGSFYRANWKNYVAELQELDAAIRKTVENGKFDTLIFADRFPVRYFVEEYGLDYYAAFPGCADDTEPSARTVAFLIDKVREEGIPAVMFIEFSNEKMADVICEDTGCEKLLFHSCHNVSAEQLKKGVSYLELMWANVESLKEALG
ncbi:MAG: metal ABC transporter substrate-binding protein [Candidatus Limivicinus sp.]|nr:metal ABC transporter substrate-binding protein [Clostridiales bacterium]MDY6132023.1 metal ABC transporter substrate-binding protein [Candidatus Limivicinus sp.]